MAEARRRAGRSGCQSPRRPNNESIGILPHVRVLALLARITTLTAAPLPGRLDIRQPGGNTADPSNRLNGRRYPRRFTLGGGHGPGSLEGGTSYLAGAKMRGDCRDEPMGGDAGGTQVLPDRVSARRPSASPFKPNSRGGKPAYEDGHDPQPRSVQGCCWRGCSETQLDVHLLPSGERARFSRDRRGTARLVAWPASKGRLLVVAEATDGLERGLGVALAQAGIALAVVNPRQRLSWEVKLVVVRAMASRP